MDKEDLLSISELSAYLPDNPSKYTIYGWVNKKTIPSIKIGRKLFFEKSKIDSWNEQRTIIRNI